MFHNFSSKAFVSIQMFKEDYFFKDSLLPVLLSNTNESMVDS